MIDTSIVGLAEAARLLGLTEGRVRQLLRSGELAGSKLNQRAWAISAAEVARYKEAREKREETRGRPTKIEAQSKDFRRSAVDKAYP